jgi:hypothetical protein
MRYLRDYQIALRPVLSSRGARTCRLAVITAVGAEVFWKCFAANFWAMAGWSTGV